MNEHERFEELISLKLDGELDAAGERELAEHLASCGRCRELYELLSGVRETLSVNPEPPEALVVGVMEGVERIDRTRRRNLRGRRIGIAAGFLAAAAVLALVVLPQNADRNADTPDNGIAPCSLDDGMMETRNTVPDDAGGNQTVNLSPGEYSLPVSGFEMSVEEYCADFYAVAYFEKLPEEMTQNGEERVFSNGVVGYEITRELLDEYADEAIDIDYPAPDGKGVMAVLVSQN